MPDHIRMEPANEVAYDANGPARPSSPHSAPSAASPSQPPDLLAPHSTHRIPSRLPSAASTITSSQQRESAGTSDSFHNNPPNLPLPFPSSRSGKPSELDVPNKAAQTSVPVASLPAHTTTHLAAHEPPPQISTSPSIAKLRPTELKPATLLRAIKSYTAADDTEFSFHVDDIIELAAAPSSDDEFWWCGISRSWGPTNGSKGYFPSDHVVIDGSQAMLDSAYGPSPTKPLQQPSPPLDPELHQQEDLPDLLPQDEDESEILAPVPVGTKVVGIDDYIPEKADELPVLKGDVIVILESPQGGWWRGMKGLGGKEAKAGWFPATVVKIMLESSAPAESTNHATNAPHDATKKPKSLLYQKSEPLMGSSKLGSALSIAIPASHLGYGDKNSGKNWYKRLVKKNEKGPRKSRSASAPHGSDTADNGDDDDDADTNDVNNVKLHEPSLPTTSPPDNTSNSSIFDIVADLRPQISNPTGSSGLVGRRAISAPSTPVSTLASLAAATPRASIFRPNAAANNAKADARLSQYIIHARLDDDQKIPGEKEHWSDGLNKTVIDQLGEKEVKRQMAIFELITTERDYVRDLGILIDVFMKQLAGRKLISAKNVEAVFSNLEQLLSVNQDLLKRLEERRAAYPVIDKLGDIFVSMGEHFLVYTMYCGNQGSALSKMQSTIHSNKAVRAFLEEIYKLPILRNLDLGGFLIKPVQRLCKYPLLLKEIMKYTPETKADYAALKLALEKMQSVVSLVNEGAKDSTPEGSKRILEIQAAFSEKMSIVTPTRCLVREDSVYLVYGDLKKPRRLFLFNDILILARKDWRDKFHLIEKASIRVCQVWDVKGETPNGLYLFEMLIGPEGEDGSRYLFGAAPDIKKQWLETYSKLTQLKILTKMLSDVNADAKAPEAQDEDDDDDEEAATDIARKAAAASAAEAQVRAELEVAKSVIDESKRRAEEAARRADAEVTVALKLRSELAEQLARNQERQRAFEDLQARLLEAETRAKKAMLAAEEADIRVDMTERKCKEGEHREKMQEHILASAKKQVEDLEGRLKEVANAKDASGGKVIELTEECRQWQKQAEKMEVELERVNVSSQIIIKQKEAEVERCKKDAETDRDRARREVDEIKERTRREMDELRDYHRRELADSIKRHSSAKAAEAAEMHLQLKSRLELELERTRTEKASAIDTIQMTMDAKIAERDRIIAEKEAGLREAAKEKESLQQKMTLEINSVKWSASQSVNGLKKSLFEVQQTVTTRDNTIRERESLITRLESQVTKLELERDHQAAEVARNVATVESARSEYRSIIADVQRVLQERTELLARKEAETQDLTRRIVAEQERSSRLEKDLEQARSEMETARRQHDEAMSRLKADTIQQRFALEKVGEQLQVADRANREASMNVECIRNQNKDLSEHANRLSVDVARLTGIEKQLEDALRRSVADLQTANTTIQTLQERLSQSKHEVAQMQANAISQRDILERREEDIKRSMVRIQVLETRQSELERIKVGIEKENADLKDQMLRDASDLKERMSREQDGLRGRLEREILDLRERFQMESNEARERLQRENGELLDQIARERAMHLERKDADSTELKQRLSLVERLEKETAEVRERVLQENQGLKEKIISLEGQIKDKQTSVTLLKKRTNNDEIIKTELEERVRELMGKADRFESLNRTLQEEASQAKHSYSVMASKLEASERDMSAMQRRMDLFHDLDQRYINVCDEFSNAAKSVKEYETELAHLREREGVKTREAAAMAALLTEISQVLEVDTWVAQPVFTRPSSPSRVNPASTEVDERWLMKVVGRIHDMRLEHDKLGSDVALYNGRVQELESLNKVVRQELKVANLAIKNLDQRVTSKTDECKTLTCEIETLKVQIESLEVGSRSEVEVLESEISAIKRSYEQDRAALIDKAETDRRVLTYRYEEQLKTLQSTTQNLEQANSSLASERAQLEKNFTDLFERLQNASSAFSAEQAKLGYKIVTLERDAEQLSKEKTELESKLAHACVELSTSQTQQAHHRDVALMMTESRSRAEAALASMNATARALAAEVETLKNERDAMRQDDQTGLPSETRRLVRMQHEVWKRRSMLQSLRIHASEEIAGLKLQLELVATQLREERTSRAVVESERERTGCELRALKTMIRRIKGSAACGCPPVSSPFRHAANASAWETFGNKAQRALIAASKGTTQIIATHEEYVHQISPHAPPSPGAPMANGVLKYLEDVARHETRKKELATLLFTALTRIRADIDTGMAAIDDMRQSIVQDLDACDGAVQENASSALRLLGISDYDIPASRH
ncbi:hypothetical protein SeMB42_g06228 [Synchytrium endobioticum]|uniref:Uncharacterized protein n=1 Tax=Synchytrium endobioticum TaxID=286115 RepID=A0A507CJM4_9FUNG|nr:hypothetical protein SeMB42_g06228 [Synchytrium endobioticum]TPX41353.1 hypothetical protein SeLEV6574_g06130 [Synchytrium endobioticum]